VNQIIVEKKKTETMTYENGFLAEMIEEVREPAVINQVNSRIVAKPPGFVGRSKSNTTYSKPTATTMFRTA